MFKITHAEFQSHSEGFPKTVSGLNTVGASAVDGVCVLKTSVYSRFSSDWFYFLDVHLSVYFPPTPLPHLQHLPSPLLLLLLTLFLPSDYVGHNMIHGGQL